MVNQSHFYVEIVDEEYGNTLKQLVFIGPVPEQQEVYDLVQSRMEEDGDVSADTILAGLADAGYVFDVLEPRYLVI